jgi:hypothetical protein
MNLLQYCIYDILLVSCFLTGCIVIRKSWPLEYKLLLALTSLTILIEVTEQICFFFLKMTFVEWLYNCFTPAECACLLYIFHRASVHPAIKRLNAVLLLFLPVGAGFLYYLYPLFITINDNVVVFYLFIELVSACSIILDLLMGQSQSPLTRQPLFWLASGMLFFSGLYIVMVSIIFKLKMTNNLYIYEMLIQIIANSCMYAGFLICFVRQHHVMTGQPPAQSLAISGKSSSSDGLL